MRKEGRNMRKEGRKEGGNMRPKISETNTHPKLNEDLNNILLNSNKFNKRNDYLDF